MNEQEAVRFTANLLRTLANMTADPDDKNAGFRAARMLDKYLKEGEEVT